MKKITTTLLATIAAVTFISAPVLRAQSLPDGTFLLADLFGGIVEFEYSAQSTPGYVYVTSGVMWIWLMDNYELDYDTSARLDLRPLFGNLDASAAWDGANPISKLYLDITFDHCVQDVWGEAPAAFFPSPIRLSLGDSQGNLWHYVSGDIGDLMGNHLLELTLVHSDAYDNLDAADINLFRFDLPGFPGYQEWDGWFSYTMNGVYAQAIPEPSTWLLLGAGAGLVAVMRRRRK